MTNFQVVGSQDSQRKVQVQNVGVYRIIGSQLLAKGKRTNWLYYLADIGTVCVFQNQGKDIWLGTNGVPVAGNTEVQLSLVPLEGQRFYNIETQMPLEYKGGSWTGTEYAQYQPASPTAILLEEDAVLRPNYKHVPVESDLALELPSPRVTDGTDLYIFVPANVENVYVSAPAGFTIIDYLGEEANMIPLESRTAYYFVLRGTKWLTVSAEPDLNFLRPGNNLTDIEDVNEAREFLGIVLFEQLVDILDSVAASDASLTFTGTTFDASRRIRINFATGEEFAAGVVGKAVDPATVRNFIDAAVNEGVAISQYNNISGLHSESSDFVLSGLGTGTLTYSAFEFVVNPDPYLRSQPLGQYAVEAGSIPVPVTTELSFFYILTDSTLAVRFSLTYDRQDFKILLLGVAQVEAGLLVGLRMTPQLASSDKQLRSALPVTSATRAKVSDAGPAGTLDTPPVSWTYEGINWSNNVNAPHVYVRPQQTAVQYTMVRDDGSVIATSQTYVDGQPLQDGSTVPVGEFSIQVMWQDITGRHYVLAGKNTYATIEEALAAAAIYEPVVPGYLRYYVELGRLIVRGDQFFGGIEYDILDEAKFRIVRIASLGGSAGVDAQGIEWRFTEGGGLLQPDVYYHIKDAEQYTLPPLTASTVYIGVRAQAPTEPKIVTTSGDQMQDSFSGEVSTELDLDIGGHQFVFVSDTTIWRV